MLLIPQVYMYSQTTLTHDLSFDDDYFVKMSRYLVIWLKILITKNTFIEEKMKNEIYEPYMNNHLW